MVNFQMAFDILTEPSTAVISAFISVPFVSRTISPLLFVIFPLMLAIPFCLLRIFIKPLLLVIVPV